MTISSALSEAETIFDSGAYWRELEARVAIPSVAEETGDQQAVRRYLSEGVAAQLVRLGIEGQVYDNPIPGGPPVYVGRRWEGDDLPTVLTYGHGDVVPGMAGRWAEDRDPWVLQAEGERWYGRGTADNKGQHTVNLCALEAVLVARGLLGFNLIVLLETGEEVGSPGLKEFCEANKDLLKADMFIGSDGPRLDADTPTLFLGARGAFVFDMTVNLRDGAHHSGNWGGLLASPGLILARALSTLVDEKGRIMIDAWRPPEVPEAVRDAVRDLVPGGGIGPETDLDWGEPGLTAGEKVFAWNSFEVLAMVTGNPAHPAGAIPPSARATCEIRYIVPSDPEGFLPALRAHLDGLGFDMIELSSGLGMAATRLDPTHPRVGWALSVMENVTGKKPALLPNLGGSLPNDVFADVLGLPTLWVPHSYPACRQHGPDEHLLAPVVREGLRLMTGLFWELGSESERA